MRQQALARRWLTPVALMLLSFLAFGVLLYPSAADWFARLNHDAEISGYTEEVEAMQPHERSSTLALAQQYNALMPQGMLRDPFSEGSTDEAEDTEAFQIYSDMLRVNGTPVMGSVDYPGVDISLPVYHGTSDEVLAKGAGHLYGSSLPIGGPGTHSVLTSHSGLAKAALFTPLTKARTGEVFTVTVLGETHHYRVDSIETVLPNETDALQIEDGTDAVTLITCVPVGINSHRLLVKGERISSTEAVQARTVLDGDGQVAGFPWWAVVFIVGNAGVAWAVFSKPRAKRGRKTGLSTPSGRTHG